MQSDWKKHKCIECVFCVKDEVRVDWDTCRLRPPFVLGAGSGPVSLYPVLKPGESACSCFAWNPEL
jgi:hypothetical protein